MKLKVPSNVSCIAFGPEIFPIVNGTVDVPKACAEQLLLSHKGYAEILPAPTAANVAQMKRKP